ncbi:uncharacterized protein [Venturia canescens]|uniref:uncharacterized protein n=1 Tax=Venturia canescens TaxID=32260 RepID=UPI001C9D2E9A|nr:uncharacterized protein LOC122405831 [Venturia canescens]
MQNSKKSKGTSCRIDCVGRKAKFSDANNSNKCRAKRNKKYRIKRQYLVYEPEEEIWHEPYMQSLKNQFSPTSVQCDSNIEFPWQDIAVMVVDDKKTRDSKKCDESGLLDGEASKLRKAGSTGLMKLPWEDLVIGEGISNVRDRKINEIATCDSSLEIPWSDLILEGTLKIESSSEVESCRGNQFEVPWDAILVPKNLIIEPLATKKHPSSKIPSKKYRKRTEHRRCPPECSKNK